MGAYIVKCKILTRYRNFSDIIFCVWELYYITKGKKDRCDFFNIGKKNLKKGEERKKI